MNLSHTSFPTPAGASAASVPDSPATGLDRRDRRISRRADRETLYGHLLFLLAAVVACIVAPLLPLQTDSAYTFFRLLQQPHLNLDDLRTLDPLTWGAMQAAVRLACAPKVLALVFALGHVVYAYLLFLLARYGFRYRQAGRLALAFACASAPLWLNPATGVLNGLCYFALALSLRQGEQWRAALRAAAVCRHGLLAALLLLCVLADPIWLFGIAFWLLYCLPAAEMASSAGTDTATNGRSAAETTPAGAVTDARSNTGAAEGPPTATTTATSTVTAANPETAAGNNAASHPRRTWMRRIALLIVLSLAAWLDRRFLPQPLDFNLDFFLPVYGFRHAFAFWGQSQAYAYLFLWAGWAYLLFRYFCRRDFRALAALLTLTAVFLALYGFKAGYPADYGRAFLPFWTLTALLVLRERQPAFWLAPAVLFLICGSSDQIKALDRRADFYGTFAAHLPEPPDKFLAYNLTVPEYSFQPSGIPQVEMLNYTLLQTARPRIVQFPLPGVAFQSPYEADLSFQVTDQLAWPAELLNPTYFKNLSPRGNFDILPADFFAYRPVYALRCTAEAYARDRADKPFFICETWPDSTLGRKSGPELVERQYGGTAFAGDYCVYTGGDAWNALPVPIDVQPGDSLFVTVKRRGNGRLVAEDYYFARQKARAVPFHEEATYAVRQIAAENDSTATPELWDHLEIRTPIPAGVHRVMVHVSANDARDTSYFDNLEIVLSRRIF